MLSAFTGTCPDLDLSSSTDSLQTHDSLVTPESPQSLYALSPHDSLDEGQAPDTHNEPVTQDSTQVGANEPLTQVVDSLAYDSLVTTLLRLSLEP